jgi:ribosome recycling factor
MDDKERIKQLEKTLEMERELYVNIRELSKDQAREINALKKAYDMQIDLVKDLEQNIDRMVRKLAES